MPMEKPTILTDVFVSITDPHQDVAFANDQMRLQTQHAAHNLARLKQLVLNLFRLDHSKRKGGIKARRLIASTSDDYRAQLLGWP